MSARSTRTRSAGSIGSTSVRSIAVSPAPPQDPQRLSSSAPGPDLPVWARKPSVYSSPEWIDEKGEEIGSNGSVAGLFVEDGGKVGWEVPNHTNYTFHDRILYHRMINRKMTMRNRKNRLRWGGFVLIWQLLVESVFLIHPFEGVCKGDSPRVHTGQLFPWSAVHWWGGQRPLCLKNALGCHSFHCHNIRNHYVNWCEVKMKYLLQQIYQCFLSHN